MSLSRQGTLANQTSQVFQMTLDELQNSLAGSGKIGSMNLEEFLAQVWDQHGNIGSNQGDQGMVQPPSNPNAPSMHTGSTDYSGKTVEEVWQAIQAGKGQTGEPFNSVNLGSFLQSVGVDMPPSVSTELHMTNLSMPSEKSMAMDTMRMPEEVDMPLIVPQQSAAAPAGSMYFQDCNPLPSEEYRETGVHACATVHTAPRFEQTKSGRSRKKDEALMGTAGLSGAQGQQRRPRKRKEPEVVDEKTARLQKRMVKNRESAARSRLRKQEYTAQLEVQIAGLKEENRSLVEKIVRACPATPPQEGLQVPLRRIRTMPSPELKKLVEEALPQSAPSPIMAAEAPMFDDQDGTLLRS